MSLKKQTKGAALNIPHAVTIVGDHLWMASFWLFASAFASNEKLTGWTGGACVAYAIFINTVREMVYWKMLGPYFAKVKTEFRTMQHVDYILDVVSTTLQIVAIAYLCCHWNIMHCTFAVSSDDNHDASISSINNINNMIRFYWPTIMNVSRDYWIINMIKDNTSMRFLHPLMHQKEHYWVHKRHHAGNKNLNSFPHAFLFNPLDLAIEFGIGPILGMAVKYYLLGVNPSIHVVSFMFCIWTDGNVHSQNPYSQAIGNVVLDWVMKLNVVHNLHHACQDDPAYMTVFPFHHYLTGALDKDVGIYNKIMDTNIDFGLFE